MDVARLTVRVKGPKVMNEVFNVEINGDILSMKIVEHVHGPIRIVLPSQNVLVASFESDSDDD